jgi:hypothetical protein
MVDLPHPDGPITVAIDPGATVRVSGLKRIVAPKRTWTESRKRVMA